MFGKVFDDLYAGLRREWKTIPWTVVSIVSLWICMVAVYFLIYPSLARGEEVKSVRDDVNTLLTWQSDMNIIQTAQLYCRVDNEQARAYMLGRLTELMRVYERITKQPYPPLPDCGKLK